MCEITRSFAVQNKELLHIHYWHIIHMPYCQTDTNISLVKLKWSLTTGERGTLPTSACTNASLFLEPFQVNDSQIYKFHYSSPLMEENKIYEQMSY